MMKFTDNIALSGVRLTRDGYLAASAKVSRTGIQQYHGSEIGRPDLGLVNVYRPESSVFHKDSMASFVGKPITDNHPNEIVNSENHSKYSRGQIGEEVARDGEAVRISLALMDQSLIDKVIAGTRELSVGYRSELEWGDGVAPDGTPYQAIQKNIFVDHVAVVKRGRAGHDFRIGDDANDSVKEHTNWGIAPIIHDEKKETEMTVNLTTVVLGDKAVQVSAADASALEAFKNTMKLQLSDAIAEGKKAVEAKDVELAKKDAEIEELNKKVLSDEEISKLVDEKSQLISDAKLIDSELDVDGKTSAEIKKAAVVSVRGEDAVKDKSEAYVDAAFELAVESAKADPNSKKTHDSVREAFKGDKTQQRTTDGWDDNIFSMSGIAMKKGA